MNHQINRTDTVIGIDLGGTNIRAALINNGNMGEIKSCPTPKSAKDYEDGVRAIINLIHDIWNPMVKAIGIGVPSVVDRKNGIVYNVMNIPHWNEVPIKRILEEEFKVPVFVDNDANCFALGERYFGVGREYDNFVGLTIGTGLGGGIIQKGNLLADANCGSGEFGELPYKDNNLEYYCSGSYFDHIWHTNGKDVYEKALKNDKEALKAFREFGRHIGVAIKMVVLTIDPEMIVFGGSVANTHALFEESMREELKNFSYPKSIEKLKIYYSELSNAGLYGAASLCYQCTE